MKRLKEPSSWAGLAALIQGLKFVIPQYSIYIDAVSAAFGGVAVTLREKGGPVVGITVQDK